MYIDETQLALFLPIVSKEHALTCRNIDMLCILHLFKMMAHKYQQIRTSRTMSNSANNYLLTLQSTAYTVSDMLLVDGQQGLLRKTHLLGLAFFCSFRHKVHFK